MATTFTIVKRPDAHRHGREPQVLAAIIGTAKHGKAVNLNLNGRSKPTVVANLSHSLKRRNLQLRYNTVSPKHIIVWAEKQPSA